MTNPPRTERSEEREPAVRFCPWTPWPRRNEITNSHLPGVYLLATWDTEPPAQTDPRSEALIYVGETTEQSLQGRWQQFDRAAFESRPGHTAGLAYRDILADDGESLYVATFVPEGLRRDLRTLFIRYIERRLLWEWARRHGEPPMLNTRQL